MYENVAHNYKNCLSAYSSNKLFILKLANGWTISGKLSKGCTVFTT